VPLTGVINYVFCIYLQQNHNNCLSNAIHCMGQNIKSLAACVCECVSAHGYWRPNISKTVRDRGLVTMGHQQEMTYGGSIGHVTDDVTWPRSRSWPPYVWAHYLENGWKQRLGYNRAPIGNVTWGIKWSRDRKRHVTLTGRGRDTYWYPLSSIWLEIHVELWLHVTLNFLVIQLHSDRNILWVLQMALDRLRVL